MAVCRVKGWSTPLTNEARDFPNEVVGVIADRSYPKPERITEILSKAPRDAVVVVRWVNKEDNALLNAVTQAGFEPIISKPTPYWQGIDLWRDAELLNTCSKVLVFRDLAKDAKESWVKRKNPPYDKVWPGLFVFEDGKAKKKPRRKGRSGE